MPSAYQEIDQTASPPPYVLVIEDEPALAALIVLDLADLGLSAQTILPHRVHASIHQAQPALIILDVQLLGHDGIEIFQELRAEPVTATTPVIFVTAVPWVVEDRLPAYTAQAAALLAKPFAFDDLRRLVLTMMDRPPS